MVTITPMGQIQWAGGNSGNFGFDFRISRLSTSSMGKL
jgi:hypothetical protein